MPLRILIADDNQRLRRGVADILASVTDWTVCGEASDGEEAIRIAQQLQPDLILLDISMPGMNGLDVAPILREKAPAAKILIMSQHDPALLLPRVLKAGAQACVDKSRLGTDLVKTIQTLVESAGSKQTAGSAPT
jgi:DNA-binding NarL/FixJ family response regulator